jgi:hypothetical protein
MVTGSDRGLRSSRGAWHLRAIAVGPAGNAGLVPSVSRPVRRAATARIASHVGTFQIRRPSGTISHACLVRASRIFRQMARRATSTGRA